MRICSHAEKCTLPCPPCNEKVLEMLRVNNKQLKALLTECIDLIEFQPVKLSHRGKMLVKTTKNFLEESK